MAPAHLTRPLRYTLSVVIIVGLLSPILSVFVAQRAAERSVRASQATADAAAERSRMQYCDLLSALLNVYVQEPPPSDTGRAVQKEYLVQYRIHGCLPPREK